MTIRLSANTYGKGRVRVMRVARTEAAHELREVTVQVMLEGDFEAIHTEADNANCVPTDTMKNTCYGIAREKGIASLEQYGLDLAGYLLENHDPVHAVTVSLEERCWKRMSVGNDPHPHAFQGGGSERPTAVVRKTQDTVEVTSGIRDLLVLKTTDSEFTGYIKDRFTTLPETTDRILATSLEAVWTYAALPADFHRARAEALRALLETFADHHSLSVQHTLYDMGKVLLEACPDIREVSMTMPNKHCLPVNLEPFGLDNPDMIYVPTDEPHGLIKGTVSR